MNRKSIPELMDKSVEWTGLPQLAKNDTHRRPMRWFPIFALVAGIVGLALSLSGPPLVGPSILLIALIGSAWMPIKGPVKAWGDPENVDEFDCNLRARAYLATLAPIMIFALIALIGLPVLSFLYEWDAMEMGKRMLACAIFLLLIWSIFPTFHASWKIQRGTMEEED